MLLDGKCNVISSVCVLLLQPNVL